MLRILALLAGLTLLGGCSSVTVMDYAGRYTIDGNEHG